MMQREAPPAATPRRRGGVAWVLLVIGALSLLNAVRQGFFGAGPLARRLAGIWAVLAVLALGAGTAARWRVRGARWLAALWALAAVVATVAGTALLFHGRPPIQNVLPGTVAVALLGWVIVRRV